EARDLEQERQSFEGGMVQQAAEGALAEAAVSDVFMAVNARAERLLRVVGVDRNQSFQAQDPLHLVHGLLQPFGRADVVAGAVQVAGIPADRQAAVTAESPDDVGQLLETHSERLALASAHLQANPRLALGLPQHPLDPPNAAPACLLTSRSPSLA